MKFILLPQPVGLLKPILNIFCTSTVQRKEICWCDFTKYMINIVMWTDLCQTGLVLDMTALYSLIPVWMTLMFTQGHRVTKKLELVLSFCCKVEQSNSNIHDGWLCKEDDCEEALYGEYGSFVHFKGSGEEWYISSMLYSQDIQFWSTTLDLLFLFWKCVLCHLVNENWSSGDSIHLSLRLRHTCSGGEWRWDGAWCNG